MAVKTDIINSLINKIKINIPEFKYVSRDFDNLNNLSLKLPLCVVNPLRIIKNTDYDVYGYTAYDMTVSLDIFHKTGTDYFETLDLLEEKVLDLISAFQNCQDTITNSVIKVDFDESVEVISNEDFDNLMHIRIIITISFRK